ncbi:MAG: priA [Phycisphaerales bacterium]|nr:priA [Phycisphaerales bacterium]
MTSADMLFPQPDAAPTAVAAARYDGPVAVVAIERSVDRVLDYAVPPKFVSTLAVGQRVRVPLGRGNSSTFGYIVDIATHSTHPTLKPMIAIDEDRVMVQPTMLQLARWIGRYYVSPLGMVLESIIPSAVKNRIGLGYTRMVRLAKPPEAIQAALEETKSKKRRTLLSRLLQLQPEEAIALQTLAFEADVAIPTAAKLAREGFVSITEEPDLATLQPPDACVAPTPFTLALNEEQAAAVDAVTGRMDRFSVNLLFGVTGSGKTEVYLRAIEKVVAAGRQAIVLVPEIALTPQTVRRFVERFSGVAVLHSALTNTERHQSWQRISSGQARVIVGARSAIFAPTKTLGLIVVDEEHESSYKQDTVPRYNARDVAIKRGQLEDVPVLLGTATPSLETWKRVTDAERKAAASGIDANPRSTDTATEVAEPVSPGVAPASPKVPPVQTQFLLRLSSRVRGLSLPKVEVLDMRQVNKLRKGVHLISPRLETLLHATFNAGEQAILLLNRRGYANCIFCSHCNEAIQCKYCDTTMTYHRATSLSPHTARTEAGLHSGQMHCHYCLAVNPLPATCPACDKKLALFGLGTQRVEEELQRKFPHLPYARVDSDTMRSKTDYEALLGRFGRGEIKLMLGTQMIAKGLDYPNVTLVGVISGDTALSLPDFRSAERTFQLITQVAGRAGRGDKPGRVVLQTFLPEDMSLQAAVRQDYEGFAEHELAHRRQARLPPDTRMVRIVVRDQSLEDLHTRSEKLQALLVDAIAVGGLDIDLRGPMPCPIERIAGYHRAQLVLTCPDPRPLQRVMAVLRKKEGLVSNEKVAVDVDPVSML